MSVTCTRCKNEAPEIEFIPYEGELKKLLHSNICNNCWEERKKMSVMVVNEYRLTPFLPEHRKILEEQMREFLNLKA